LAALAALWHWRAPIIEAVAPWAPEVAGLGPAGLRVAALTPQRIELADLTLGGDTVTADRLTLDLDPAELMRGRPGPLTIEGLRVSAAWNQDTGLTLGPLTPLLSADDDGGRDSPTVPRPSWIELRDARVTVATPWGEMRALGDAFARPHRPDPLLSADLTVTGAGVIAAGAVSLTERPRPALVADIEAQAEIRDRPGLARGLGGSASVRIVGSNRHLELTSRALDLTADSLDPDLVASLPPVLAALARGPLAISLSPSGGDDTARLVVPLGPKRETALPSLDGSLMLRTDRLLLTADARVQTALAVPESPAGALSQSSGTLDVGLSVWDLSLPGLGTVAEARTSGRLDVTAEGVTWRSPSPARLRLVTLDDGLAEALTPALGRQPVTPLTLRLGARDRGDDTWTARLTPRAKRFGAGWHAMLAAGLDLTDRDGLRIQAEADLAAEATDLASLANGSVTLKDLSVSASGLTPAGLEGLRVDLTSERLTVADARVAGPLSVRADADRLDHPSLKGDHLEAHAQGRMDWSWTADGSNGLLTPDAAEVTLESPTTGGDGWRGPERLTLTLDAEQPQVLVWELPDQGEPGVIMDLTLAPVTLAGTVDGVAEDIHLSGRLPATDALPFEARAHLPQARTPMMPVRDLSARLRIDPPGPTLDLSGQVSRLPGETSPTNGERHPMRPLRGSATLAPDPETPDRYALSARIGAPLRAEVTRATGWISRDGTDGQIRLSVAPLPLGGAKGLQPWHLHGSLMDLSTSAGTLAMQGTISWRNGGDPRPDLTFGLADVDTAYGTTGLQRVNGTVRLTGVSPLAGPVNELVAAKLSMGLPFSDLSVRFRLDGKGGFVLERARMHLAEGEITTGPATIPLAGFERIPLTLDVRGVNLAELAALTPIQDLEITGTIDGQVPMVITPGAVRIDTARMAAAGPGVLRYSGDALPEGMQSVELARDALRNFDYSDLSMTVDGGTAEDMTLGVRLEGANSDVLGGYPFQLNLNVTGPLSRMVQDSLQGYTIPKRIADRLQRLGLSR